LQSEEFELVILNTSDSHGHLFPIPSSYPDISSQMRWCQCHDIPKKLGGISYLATVVQNFRKIKPHVLFFDTGDIIGDTLISNLTKGRLNISLMNLLSYDGVTVGNHDLDYGLDELKKRIEEANFPFLAANMLDEETKTPILGEPVLVKQINDISIGIYGLTYHQTDQTTTKKNTKGIVFELDFGKILKDIQLLKKNNVDFVIVLSHLGTEVDKVLAVKVPDIDLILGGHSHDSIPLKEFNGVYLSHILPYYTGLGSTSIIFHKKKVKSIRGKLIPILPNHINPYQPIENQLILYRKKYQSHLEKPVGYTHIPLVRNYRSESPVDILFSDIIREMTNSQIAMLPGVGYGITIPPGTITLEMITNLLPHRSNLYRGYLKGHDLLKTLEQSIINQINPDVTKRVGGMIQASGMTYEYTLSEEMEQKIFNPMVAFSPLELDQYYSVVVNQLLFEGGHHFKSLTRMVNVTKVKGKDLDLILQWFQWFSIHAISNWSSPKTYEDIRKGKKECFPLNEKWQK